VSKFACFYFCMSKQSCSNYASQIHTSLLSRFQVKQHIILRSNLSWLLFVLSYCKFIEGLGPKYNIAADTILGNPGAIRLVMLVTENAKADILNILLLITPWIRKVVWTRDMFFIVGCKTKFGLTWNPWTVLSRYCSVWKGWLVKQTEDTIPSVFNKRSIGSLSGFIWIMLNPWYTSVKLFILRLYVELWHSGVARFIAPGSWCEQSWITLS